MNKTVKYVGLDVHKKTISILPKFLLQGGILLPGSNHLVEMPGSYDEKKIFC